MSPKQKIAIGIAAGVLVVLLALVAIVSFVLPSNTESNVVDNANTEQVENTNEEAAGGSGGAGVPADATNISGAASGTGQDQVSPSEPSGLNGGTLEGQSAIEQSAQEEQERGEQAGNTQDVHLNDLGFPVSSANYQQAIPELFNAEAGGEGRARSIDAILSYSTPIDQLPEQYRTDENLIYFFQVNRADAVISYEKEEVIESFEPQLVFNDGQYTLCKLSYVVRCYGNDSLPGERIENKTAYIRCDNNTKKFVEMYYV